jgi:pimeloyl-ACP methyl ester carboxylesterase
MTESALLNETDVPQFLLTRSMDRGGFRDEYPFDSHWLRTADGILHYVDEGSGPTLLLVHGNPTWSFAWRHLIRELRGNYRVIAIDHLGCGFSEKPTAGPYVLDRHIHRLQQLVETLDLNDISLFAHDWGGAIGMGCAGRMPDRFGRFVLMNTAAFRSTRIPLRIAVCRIPFLGALGMQGLNLFSSAAVRMAVMRPLSAAAKAGMLAPYDSWANRTAVREFVHDIPLRSGHRSYQTLVEVEDSLSQQSEKPMQLIWGMKDWCFSPEFLREFEQRFPTAGVHQIADAGHYVFEDAADEVVDISRQFLSVCDIPQESRDSTSAGQTGT